MKRALLLLSLCACATQNAQTKTTPTAEQLKVSNIGWFDLAYCTPPKVDAPTPLNVDALTGILVTNRAPVYECLLDATHRGTDVETSVTIETTVTDAGATHNVTGENLKPEAVKCIQDAFAKLTIPPPAKGQTVKAKAQFVHTQSSPSVSMGVNEASDLVGTLRMAESGWCDCFAGWKTARTLKEKVHLQKGKPVEVTPEPTNDPEADKVAACIKDKIVKLNPQARSDELTVTVPFLFLDPNGELAPNEPPALLLEQFDAQRSIESAKVAMKIGARAITAAAWNDTVNRHKKTKGGLPLDELKKGCQALVTADGEWISSLESLNAVNKKALALAQDQKTKEPDAAKKASWGDVEASLQQKVADIDKDAAGAKQAKTLDEGACPKVKY